MPADLRFTRICVAVCQCAYRKYIILLSLKGAVSQLNSVKNLVCNLCQSSPFLTILSPLWIIIITFVFSYLFRVLFSGFLQFKGDFVDGRNNCDVAPLND